MADVIKFNKDQKNLLNHFVLNCLTRSEIAKLKKKIDKAEEFVILDKAEAQNIIQCIENIRKFLLELEVKKELRRKI